MDTHVEIVRSVPKLTRRDILSQIWKLLLEDFVQRRIDGELEMKMGLLRGNERTEARYLMKIIGRGIVAISLNFDQLLRFLLLLVTFLAQFVGSRDEGYHARLDICILERTTKIFVCHVASEVKMSDPT